MPSSNCQPSRGGSCSRVKHSARTSSWSSRRYLLAKWSLTLRHLHEYTTCTDIAGLRLRVDWVWSRTRRRRKWKLIREALLLCFVWPWKPRREECINVMQSSANTSYWLSKEIKYSCRFGLYKVSISIQLLYLPDIIDDVDMTTRIPFSVFVRMKSDFTLFAKYTCLGHIVISVDPLLSRGQTAN